MGELADLFSELIRCETELWNGVDRQLREKTGLPLNRFEPLRVIGQFESCRVLDVAAVLAIGASGTSKLIDRLETDGLCERRSHPEDRRSVLVSLTPAGGRLLSAADRVFQAELVRRIGGVLDHDDRAVFIDALRRLRAGQASPHDPPPSDHQAIQVETTSGQVGSAAESR